MISEEIRHRRLFLPQSKLVLFVVLPYLELELD